jgi:hypothetical protein
MSLALLSNEPNTGSVSKSDYSSSSSEISTLKNVAFCDVKKRDASVFSVEKNREQTKAFIYRTPVVKPVAMG